MADTRNPREVVDIGKFQPYDHPQYGSGAVREITYIDGTIERRFFHHGTEKEGEGAPDSGYLVDTKVEPKLRAAWDQARPPASAAATDPTSPAGRSAAANATEAETKAQEAVREAAERKKNRELPPDQDPRDETDAQRAVRAEARIKQQGIDARAEADRNKPGAPTLKPDGKGGTIAIQTMPDGTIKETPLPNIPSEVAAKYTEVKQDPQTGKWQGFTKDGKWEPIEGGPGIKQSGTPAEPAGAPPASTQYGAIIESRVKYRDFLNKQVQLHANGDPARGIPPGKEGVSAEQADKLMEARLAQDKAIMDEQAGVVGTQTTIYGQQQEQRRDSLRDSESRRNAANTAYTAVLQQFTPLLRYMPKGGGQAFLDLLAHGTGAAQQNATAWGGMAAYPENQHGPAAAEANRAPMPGGGQASAAAPPAVLPYAPGTTPVPTQGTFLAPYDSNAAATREAAMQAESAQMAAQHADTPTQITDATSGTIQNLLTPPAVQGEPSQVGDTGAPPISMAPQPSFLDPYQQPPSGALDSLLNDGWISNDIVARAYEDVWGQPMASMRL
jgi:hypothetical protein